MSPWKRAFRLSLGRRSVEQDVDDELAFHLAMREEKLRRLGLPPETARTQAQTRFGDQEKVRDECITIDSQYERQVTAMEWLESVWYDFRYALRTLRRMPAFTIVATLTLALGIRATSAMFTLVDSILLRPLPYPDPDRLVRLIQSYPEKGLDTWGVSQENIVMYRDNATDFESFAGIRGGSATLTGTGDPQRLTTARVTADFFKTIGVVPAIGRPFTRDEDSPGRNDVVVLSDGFWRTHFGANQSVIGTTIDLDGKPTRIIGVMPRDFAYPNYAQAWQPMGLDPTRVNGWINSGLGRLKPGISVEHAARQTTTIMHGWARRRAEIVGRSTDPDKTRMKTLVTPLRDAITGRSARSLEVLLAAVSLILLIAIANVATLFSSRAAARQREIGLRSALGASSNRVARQLLTESVTLSLLGAVVGIAFAYGAVRAFTRSQLVSLPRMNEVTVDGRVLAVTLVISVVSGILFGLLPALHSVRARLTSDLTSGTREASHRGVRRLNDGLVVAQLSLSVVLLIAAGLMLESFQRITRTDLGFRPEGVSVVSLALPSRINSAASLDAFARSVLGDVRAIPGARPASLAWAVPFDNGGNVDGYLIEGRPVPPSGNEDQISQIAVTSDYFSTLGIPLRYGRDISMSDDTTAVPVALVDETLAQRYWKGAEAIGKRIRVTGDTTWLTIVGVVGSVRDNDPASLPMPHMYVSLTQAGGNRLALAVRVAGSAPAVLAAVRRAVARLEPSIPLDGIRTLSSLVDKSLDTRRLTEILLTAFAALAVVLAGVGIYGVMSLAVANRNREFGVRLAIGAQPAALVWQVLREGARLAALGVGVGVVGALVATRWIGSLLYEVSPTDPVVFTSLSLLLGAIAVASCWIPARRAARSNPLTVLRAD